ncbi:MAG: histidine phosphotransferase family protein [Gemmobacter sp.]
MNASDLAGLLGSRICHDLISPLGAIGNGVELLAMDAGQSPEMALIAESVENAKARVMFFRVAFGAAAADQRMGRPEVLSILSGITRGTRLSIDWRVPGDLPRREVKLAFLLLQCAETALAFGGQIGVERDGGIWTIEGRARRLRIDEPLWEALAAGRAAERIGPAEVQFALAAAELSEQRRKLLLDRDATGIALRF